MSRRGRKLWICNLLIVLNLCSIWGNSLMPAQISQAFSDGVQSILPGTSTAISVGILLRKAAHFAEFAVLGMLLYQRFLLQEKKGLHPLLCGVLIACIDEIIQFFIPGRNPWILDVIIDACGVVTGMFLLQIGNVLWRKNQQKPYGGN